MINKGRTVFFTALLVLGLAAAAAAAAPSNFSVQADELEYDLDSGQGTAKGHVVLTQEDGQATGTFASFNSKSKTGYLEGNVVADREDAHIACDKFIMHSEDFLSAVGSATLVKEGRTLNADQVDYYKTRGYAETIGDWARLTDVDGSTMDAVKITYDITGGVAEATGGVNIASEARKLTASANQALYQAGAGGEIILIGNAKAVQDGNAVAGARLKLTNNKYAIADGNTRMVYIPKEKNAAEATDEAEAAATAEEGAAAEGGEAAATAEQDTALTDAADAAAEKAVADNGTVKHKHRKKAAQKAVEPEEADEE